MKLAGRHALEVMHLIAEGNSYSEIARQFDCDPSAVRNFAIRRAARIAEIKEQVDNEFAGLWVAKKINRVAEYERDIEDFEDSDEPEYRRIRQAALKAVAEELGHLRQIVDLEAKATHYVVEGIDPKDLT